MSNKRPHSPLSEASSSKRSKEVRHEGGVIITARPSKRSHAQTRNTIADLFPFQEIFLRILSFLTPSELAAIQSVNKYWSKMSLDPQLWKRLYLSRYPHPHHSRLVHMTDSGPSTSPRNLRSIARLPSRAFPPPSPSRTPSRVDHAELHDLLGGGSGSARPMTRGEAMDGVEDVGHGVRNDGVDWKVMLRLGSNWSNGNAVSQRVVPLPGSPNILPTNPRTQPRSVSPPYTEHHIALFPSFIFTSHPDSPLVHVHLSSTSRTASRTKDLQTAPIGIIPPPPGWSSPTRPDNITAICADDSVSIPDDPEDTETTNLPARLVVFHQSGGFVILRVKLSPSSDPEGGTAGINWIRESVHPPRSRPKSLRRRTVEVSNDDPVVLASMYFPVLIACTLSFHLSVYTLSTPVNGETVVPKCLQTLHSDVSSHPAALSLFPDSLDGVDTDAAGIDQRGKSFRAALTYCTPLYPASWTISVQEINIDLPAPSRLSGSGQVWRGECWNVGRGDDDADDGLLVWPRKVKPLVGVRGKRPVGVGMDGRWCVLAGEDNQIQVYSLPTPSPSPPPSSTSGYRRHQENTTKATLTPPIVHSQTLLAHSGAVTSISLAAGRCVSSARDGRILVWELDGNEVAGTGTGRDDFDDEGGARLGRTIGYVEVKEGGRRGKEVWRGATGPQRLSLVSANDMDEDEECDENEGERMILPHPQSISSAARTLFLPLPPALVRPNQNAPSPASCHVPHAIRQLAFDEEKIVGLVGVETDGRGGEGFDTGVRGEVMKVWSFS